MVQRWWSLLVIHITFSSPIPCDPRQLVWDQGLVRGHITQVSQTVSQVGWPIGAVIEGLMGGTFTIQTRAIE
jgi:hypothetical protein